MEETRRAPSDIKRCPACGSRVASDAISSVKQAPSRWLKSKKRTSVNDSASAAAHRRHRARRGQAHRARLRHAPVRAFHGV